MSGHPGHKEPTPAFFAPLNQPSPNSLQPGSGQARQDQSMMQPEDTQPTPAAPEANAIAPQQQTAVKQTLYKTILQKAAMNKAFAIFIAMNVLSLGMGSYILLAPSNETLSNNARAYIPASTPTPFPVEVPTTAPSPILTPEPTEEIVEEIIEEPTPESTETPIPTPSPDPTDSWNTYTNVDYGYSIKYPLNWTAINMGVLEPKVPSYVVFNINTASTSARSITVSVSSRTYEEQLSINGTPGSPYTVAEIQGTWQDLKDSDGNRSIAITLPRTNTLLILRAKTPFASTLYQMLPTLYVSE